MSNILPEMHVLYVHSKAGGLVAYFYHPNRAAVELKRDEMAGDMFPGSFANYEYTIVRYVVAEEQP